MQPFARRADSAASPFSITARKPTDFAIFRRPFSRLRLKFWKLWSVGNTHAGRVCEIAGRGRFGSVWTGRYRTAQTSAGCGFASACPARGSGAVRRRRGTGLRNYDDRAADVHFVTNAGWYLYATAIPKLRDA